MKENYACSRFYENNTREHSPVYENNMQEHSAVKERSAATYSAFADRELCAPRQRSLWSRYDTQKNTILSGCAVSVVVFIVLYSQPTARVMEESVQSAAAQLAARPQLDFIKTPNLYKVAVHTSLRKETREEQIFAAFLHQAQAEVAAEKLEKLEKANARLEKTEAKILQEQEAKDISERVRKDLHEARILTSNAGETGFQNVEQTPRRTEAKGTMKTGFRSTMAAHATASTPPPSVIHAVSELQALLNATNKELQAVSVVQAHLRNSSAATASLFTNISSSDISTSDSVLSPRPNIFKVEDANRTLSLTLDSRTAPRQKVSYRKGPLAEINSSNMKADVGHKAHKVRQDDAGAILQLGMHAHMSRTPFLFRVQTTTMLWIIVSVLAVLACTSTLRSQYKQRHDLAHFQSKEELSMITAEEYSMLM